MFSEVYVLNQDNTRAKNPASGLDIKRRCLRFIPDGDKESIYVFYKQWEVGLDGSEVNPKEKSYFIKNTPAVFYPAKTIINQATYYVQGEVISPSREANGTEIKTPPTYYLEGEVMSNNEIAIGGELKTPAVYYSIGETIPAIIAVGGELKTPASISTGQEIETPATFAFDSWKGFQITTDMVGFTLENFFIDMQINPRLKYLPFNIPDEYNNN